MDLHRPLIIGMVHGLAGSAGILLLIKASMPSVAQGRFFALSFGLGTVPGMVMCGTIIGLPFHYRRLWLFDVAFYAEFLYPWEPFTNG